jgi:hypothetical protein
MLAQLGIGAIFWFEIGLRWRGDARLFLTDLVMSSSSRPSSCNRSYSRAAILFRSYSSLRSAAFTALLNAPPDATSRRTLVGGSGNPGDLAGALTTTNGFAAAPALALIAWPAAAAIAHGSWLDSPLDGHVRAVLSCWSAHPGSTGPPAGQQGSSPSAGALALYSSPSTARRWRMRASPRRSR